MRRRLRRLLIFATLASMLLPFEGAVAYDPDAHPTSRFYARTYTRWALGSPTNPIDVARTGNCGAVVGTRFFVAPPVDDGFRGRCRVPEGLAIVLSHAGAFTWIPFDGDTDAEIIAAADALFTPKRSRVALDGRRIDLEGMTSNLGAFTVWSLRGSFYDEEIGLGTGPIRTSMTGTFITFGALDCGRHRIRAFVDYGGPDGRFRSSWAIRVVGCDGGYA